MAPPFVLDADSLEWFASLDRGKQERVHKVVEGKSTELDLSKSEFTHIPGGVVETWKALTELILRSCPSLAALPESIGQLRALTTLNLNRCTSLKSPPLDVAKKGVAAIAAYFQEHPSTTARARKGGAAEAKGGDEGGSVVGIPTSRAEQEARRKAEQEEAAAVKAKAQEEEARRKVEREKAAAAKAKAEEDEGRRKAKQEKEAAAAKAKAEQEEARRKAEQEEEAAAAKAKAKAELEEARQKAKQEKEAAAAKAKAELEEARQKAKQEEEAAAAKAKAEQEEAQRNAHQEAAAAKAKGIEDLLRGREDLLESLLQQATATSSSSGASGQGVGSGGGGGGSGGADGNGPSLDAATARLLSSHRGELSQLIQHQHLSNADRATVDAILRSPATKSYYLSFLSRSQSLLVACGVVHSGMVEGTAWSLNDEAMGFVQEATKPGGSFTKAAKAVKWGRTLAAGVSAAKEQLSGVPFANLAGSILEYLLSSRDEQEQKTQLLRAATFTALAGGGGGGAVAPLRRQQKLRLIFYGSDTGTGTPSACMIVLSDVSI